MGLSVKKERGVNTSVIAPLFCPQSLDNLFEIYQISIPKVSETTSEVLFVTTIYKSLHPSKELLTVNLCDDLGNVSSETVANIVRSKNSWIITISATGNNNKYNEKCLAEMIFIKK